MSESLGIGIIGPGAIADLHAQAIEGLAARIVAAAGPEPQDLADFATRHAVPSSYSTHEALLEDPAVDAVIVSAPSHVHASLSAAALKAGKPVLCEVPVAVSLQDATAVVELAERLGLPFAVAHTLRYWEPHRRLVAELAAIGAPATHVVVRSLMLRQSDVGWTGKVRSWTDSAIWHHGSHAVDAALWLLGDVAVQSSATTGSEWTNGQIMDAAFTLRTADSRIATVDVSYHARRPKADFLVITESDTFEIVGATLLRNDVELMAGDVALVQSAAVLEQDRAFIDAVNGNGDALYLANHALPALQVLAGATATA